MKWSRVKVTARALVMMVEAHKSLYAGVYVFSAPEILIHTVGWLDKRTPNVARDWPEAVNVD